MSELMHDLRLSMRGFRRTPAFTITALLILGLAIGMAAAMFTVYDRVLVRRLPVSDEGRVVVLWTHRGDPTLEVSGSFKHLAEGFGAEARTLESVAGVSHWGAAPTPFLDGDESITLNRALVTGNYFDVLGAVPALGRLLRADDEVPGAILNMVISHGAWTRRFGGDSAVIGRTLHDAWSPTSYRIVGVAPAGLDYPSGVEAWTPPWTSALGAYAVGRLKPGVGPAAAADEFFRIEQRLLPDWRLAGVRAQLLHEAILGDVSPVLIALASAVALLLVLACVNVGNLLLLRVAARGRELLIRRSLGATRGAIVRQLMVESIALGLGGGVLGLVACQAFLQLLVVLAPSRFPRLDALRLTGVPIGATAVVTVVAIALFGVLPALTAAGSGFASLRVASRAGGESRARRRVRQALVASQVSLALVLLSGAALLVRSLERLTSLDLGYDAGHLAIVQMAWTPADTAKVAAIGEALLSRFQGVPGVQAASPILLPPFLGANVFHGLVELEGQSAAERERNPSVPLELGGPDFFRTFGIPIDRGRGFVDADREDAPQVAVVSASLARRLWPGENPVGKRIKYWGPDSLTWRTIVGVAGDIRYRNLREANATIFLPWRQARTWQFAYAVRTRGELSSVLPLMRREARAVDGGLTIWDAKPMDDYLAVPLAQPRLSTFLLSGFGATALLLAAIGLYGVMASTVRAQAHDIGVRMALGAAPGRVRREVLGQALLLTAIGALAGLVTALAAGRLLRALLFDVRPTDPLALAGASAVLVLSAFGAAYLPARRATRIDPATSLRND